MQRIIRLQDTQRLLNEAAVLTASRCHNNVNTSLIVCHHKACTLLVQNIFARRFQNIIRIRNHEELSRLDKGKPSILIRKGQIIFAHPAAVIDALYVMEKAVGTRVQHSHRL